MRIELYNKTEGRERETEYREGDFWKKKEYFLEKKGDRQDVFNLIIMLFIQVERRFLEIAGFFLFNLGNAFILGMPISSISFSVQTENIHPLFIAYS